jgi:hypothetical protein
MYEYLDRDLRQDLWRSDEFLHKIRTRHNYAQNVYAALCNTRWQPLEVIPILKDQYWSCSWRSAGGIVADFLGQGDYMDWYCSGMGGFAVLEDETEEEAQAHFKDKGFVPEGTVTDEIAQDFAKMGWSSSPWPKDNQ